MTASLITQHDDGRVRVVTFNRPKSLNAFSEALYDATADAILAAADDANVAVLVLTGAGSAFSAGADLFEMAQRNSGDFVNGRHGFPGMVDALIDFPKPLICAVNGVGVGIGATMLGFADLVFMSATARLKCPFASLGVAPEAASSFTLPRLVGRQEAAWVLMSSEWITAAEAHAMGLAWKVCEPDALLATAIEHAQVLAQHPIGSLVEIKRAIVEPLRADIAAARERENQAFIRLLGSPANVEALRAFAEKRNP